MNVPSFILTVWTILLEIYCILHRKLNGVTLQEEAITGFTLIQAPTTVLGPVPSTIDLSIVGTTLNIKANIASCIGATISKVTFTFDGTHVRTESTAPYSLGGNQGEQYNYVLLLTSLGTHIVTAEAYNSTNHSIATRTIEFTVINETIVVPTASIAPVMHPTPPFAAPITTPFTLPAPAPIPPPPSIPNVAPTIPIVLPSPTSSEPIKIPLTLPVPTPIMFPFSVPIVAPTIPVAPPISPTPSSSVRILGELRKWHKVTLAFTGPSASETSTVNNPFMNYRFDVTFIHQVTKKIYKIPGYFAADGNAAETSATSGDQWFCHFSPDAIGNWDYTASFVTGTNVSVTTTGGTPTSFHGQSGTIAIETTNKVGRDHRGKGRLQYVGEHHLKFAESGEYFLKAGADSPENFLAYVDFDNTPNHGNRRKTWEPHVKDFVDGDPTWKNDKGKGIIGAINYLSKQGMNVFSFLTMNINGDDRNVYPYVSDGDFLRMDVSKLAQWEVVFEHADKMGMFLHFKTAERENDQLLDGGNLGDSRKLYFRELIARFSHHLALNWNLAEEISNSIPQIKSFSDYFKQTDPYKNLVVTHTWPDDDLYKDLLGHLTFDGPSIQTDPIRVFNYTLRWVTDSAAAGHKWIVTNDEQGPADIGVKPDANDPNHDFIRQHVLWGNVMAGGAGVEYYFGYDYTNSDLTCEDFSSRQNMWTQSRYLLEFFLNNNVPFWQMSNNANRTSSTNDKVLSSADGNVHVVYRRSTTTSAGIKLDGLSGMYNVMWYNPRSGGSLQNGSVVSIQAGNFASVPYGSPPIVDGKDWVILIRKV